MLNARPKRNMYYVDMLLFLLESGVPSAEQHVE